MRMSMKKAQSALNSLDVEEAAGMGLKGNKERDIRNWIKGNP